MKNKKTKQFRYDCFTPNSQAFPVIIDVWYLDTIIQCISRTPFWQN